MKLYRRENYLSKIRGFYHDTELIKVITGIRRCGKSCLMQTIAEELKEAGVQSENIVYINLDKRGFKSIKTPEQLEEVIDKSCTAEGIKYLFIDEVQNIKNFEPVINAWREDGNISIFLTGSNSYLLSGELATKLTGRYIEVDMYPLTFEEYLNMKQFLNIPLNDDSQELTNFIYEGGFPYALKLRTTEAKKEYTENLIEEIFQKDIRSRLKIRNRVAFDAIMKYFIANFGAPTNLTNIVKDLNARGIKVKIETANKYILALENAKILIRCDRFDMKSRKSLIGDKKYYLSDTSFRYALLGQKNMDYGHIYENIVAIELLRRGYEVYVGVLGDKEVDFIVIKNGYKTYIQVSDDISRETTINREITPLLAIRDAYPKIIIANTKHPDYDIEGIKVIDIANWLAGVSQI